MPIEPKPFLIHYRGIEMNYQLKNLLSKQVETIKPPTTFISASVFLEQIKETMPQQYHLLMSDSPTPTAAGAKIQQEEFERWVNN
jgi:hypothetical protein